ncbi:hypothetical protein [Streptomyces albidoflavus]|uniref:hypothetical protein n=1 Tax=Streptomyces albidoflavus TaxID=1886 RepID=UPI003326BBCE
MTEPYTYTDRDGDELEVRTVDYNGTPYAALGIHATNGVLAAVHIPPEDAWEICEEILQAAGVDTGSAA